MDHGDEPSALDRSIEEAASSAFMGSRIHPGERLGAVKRPLLRAAQLVTAEQLRFNQAVLQSLRATSTTLAVLQREIQRISDDLGATRARTDDALHRSEQFESLVAELRAMVQSVHDTLERHERARLDDRTELQVERSRFAAALADLAQRPDADRATAAGALVEETQQEQFDWLYSSLEASFRGDRADIIERQRPYLEDLKLPDTTRPFLDIGCGRGEWLQLLRDSGIPAYGMDLSESFAEQGRERGLDVRAGDGIAHLRNLDEESLSGVSAFHVAEHLPLDVLVGMLDAALRALVPGGVLVLETPNPTNVTVGSANFWIDPTHQRPLHPELLRFLVEQRGFVDVTVRFLNPLPPVLDPSVATSPSERAVFEFLNRAFSGPADYGVIARRAPRVTQDAEPAATLDRNDS